MKKIVIVTALLGVISLQAQQSKWCGTMPFLESQISQDLAAQKAYDDFLTFSKQQELDYKNGKSSRAFSDTIYIPVVFHIVHNGDPIGTGENITDAQVLSQIPVLNEDFSLTNPNKANIPAEFRSLAGSTKIRFCMAQFDPQGNITTGIKRYNMSAASWDQNAIEQQLKPATIWDRTKYLNIWVVRMGGSLATDGVLAYAQFPFVWAGSANTDGIAARYDVIGTVGTLLNGYDKGRSLGHEIGHWLGLYHIWGDDAGKCAGQQGAGSDFINDTPDQGDQYFGCPSHPQTSCGSNDMFMNYMDYTNDDCRNMFTIEQCAKMESNINSLSSRTGFKTAASKCFYNLDLALTKVVNPSDSICANDFTPIVLLTNKGMVNVNSLTIRYVIDNIATTFNWSGSLPAQTAKYINLPNVTGLQDGSHQFDIAISAPNGLAKDDNQINDSASFIFQTYSSSSFVLPSPLREDFEGGFFPPAGWDIQNPNNDGILWKENNTTGAYGLSTHSIWIDNNGYSTNPNKRKDAFVPIAVDFTNDLGPKLSFDYAYSKRGTRYDSLAISFSLDCGYTWETIWGNGGQDMATIATDTMRPFIPKSNEWKSVGIPINYLRGQPNVLFKFENTAGWGNSLFIDNINFATDPNGIESISPKVSVAVFPNPATNTFTVKLPENHPFERIEITDQLGRIVAQKSIVNPISFINSEHFSEGVYIIQLISKSSRQTEKLVIAR